MYHDQESAINYLADNYEFEIVFKGGEIRTAGGTRPLPSMTLADLKALLEAVLKPVFLSHRLERTYPSSDL